MAVLDRFLIENPDLQRRFFPLAKRFVAGESVAEAVAVLAELNAAGLRATLDFLGEDVYERAEAENTRDAYDAVLDAVRAAGAQTNVSVKLTALGLLVDEEFCTDNVRAIVARASANDDPFVRIDMEGSAVVDTTLNVMERIFQETGNVGPVLQAYLKRTPDDVERCIALGARVRLCKGAYNEDASIAHKDMDVIRREYLRSAEALLTRGTYPAIATHDPKIVRAVKTFVAEHGIAKDRFEFQMLFGVRPELQRALVAEGFTVRVYVPYGSHWAGYFYRRIMERRENAFFALRSMIER